MFVFCVSQCFQCLVTEKDGQIVEAATVVDYLCRASEFSEALLGGKDASSLKVGRQAAPCGSGEEDDADLTARLGEKASSARVCLFAFRFL